MEKHSQSQSDSVFSNSSLQDQNLPCAGKLFKTQNVERGGDTFPPARKLISSRSKQLGGFRKSLKPTRFRDSYKQEKLPTTSLLPKDCREAFSAC